MIFVNYKTYEEGTGQKAVSLTGILEEVAKQTQVKIIAVVQVPDIKEVVASTTLEVWAQKVDAVEFGAHTGSIIPEAVVEDGAMGTFLNHSENRFSDFDELAKALDRAKEVGLKTLIFAKDIQEIKNTCSLTPNYIAFEPPELIGSSEVSVSSAMPEVVKQAAETSKGAGIPLVVGAGIHSRQDVKKSLEMGAVGVAVASDVMKAQDPKAAILDLAEGFE
ncbi:triose-phosphate isomerase [Patescibacteria group bacterium]